MKKKMTLAATLCVLMAGAAEKKVQMKDLPPAVQQAIQEQTKGAEVKGLSQEKENGKLQYEVETVVNGKTRDITLDDKGTLIEVEQEVGMETVPGPAKAAIEKRAAGGKIVKVETVTRGTAVLYEATYSKGGRNHEVLVNAAGNPVKD